MQIRKVEFTLERREMYHVQPTDFYFLFFGFSPKKVLGRTEMRTRERKE